MISSLCSGRLEVAKDIRKNGVTVPRGGRPQCVTCQYRSDRLEANMSGTGDLVISSCFPPQTHQQRMDHGFPYQQHRHPRVLANQESLALPLHCTRTIPPPPCCRLRHNTITTDRPRTQARRRKAPSSCSCASLHTCRVTWAGVPRVDSAAKSTSHSLAPGHHRRSSNLEPSPLAIAGFAPVGASGGMLR